MVVGLGEKEVESDAETSEECKRTANLRQASGGKMLLIMVIIGHTAKSVTKLLNVSVHYNFI